MSNNTESGGITFVGLLQVLFIGLKLAHVIDWPWVWVLSPIWMSMALLLLVFAVLLVIALVKDNRRR